MSTALLLLVVAWVALVAVAFVAAVLHFLPQRVPVWEAPQAPTLAEEARV